MANLQRTRSTAVNPERRRSRSRESRGIADSESTNDAKCPNIDRHRLLIVDLGHSTVRSLASFSDEIISWDNLAEKQQEQRAGVVFVTGAPKCSDMIPDNDFERLFPGWYSESILTDGSGIAVLWNPNYWHATDFTTIKVTQYPLLRTALALKLRRVTTHNNAGCDDYFVIVTKFHQGTAASGHQFQAQDRKAAWESMLNTISRESTNKWLIAGALATQEVQLAINLKVTKINWNPTRVFS